MTIKCDKCDKEVEAEEALKQHQAAKHAEIVKTSFLTKKNKKKIIVWLIAIIILALIIAGIYYWSNRTKQEQEIIANITAASLNKIPIVPTHWHPTLKIIIDNKTYPIPAGIGNKIGKTADVQYGMDVGMAPTHTHSADGVIHLENNNPRVKPETFALGYFFYVWEKEFSKSCIFEYCITNGTLKMYVNGIENDEFENYVMQDKDAIVITYMSFVSGSSQNPT